MKSKLAIISFILGIISLIPIFVWILPVGSTIQFAIVTISFLNIFVAPIGLILGVISLFVIKKNKLGGLWIGLFGILFSVMGLIILGFIVAGLGAAMTSFL